MIIADVMVIILSGNHRPLSTLTDISVQHFTFDNFDHSDII